MGTTVVKPIRYTDHARDRMVERGVTEAHVEGAIGDPNASKLPDDPLGRKRIIGYPEGANSRGLRVIYSEDEENTWIISVNWVGA